MSFQTKLVDVPGLGERSAQGLTDNGITSLEDLADADAPEVAEAANVEDWRAETWIDKAGSMVEEFRPRSPAESPSEGRASARQSAAEIGSAPADEYVTASSNSVTVEKYRKMMKAAASYSVVVGQMTQSEADALLQEAYGNGTETTVPADQISDLTDQWV